jgi:hypothetical protein
MLKMKGGRDTLRVFSESLLDTLPPLLDWEPVKAALGAHYSVCFALQLRFERKVDPNDRGGFPPSHSTADSDGSLKSSR